MIERMVDELTSDVHELDEEEMKYALCTFWEHDKLQDVLPDFVQEMRDTQRSLRVFENVKSAYGHMATNRSSANLIYRNALLSTVVFCKSGVSQSFILRTIGANRYPLRKAIMKRIYVG
jgi:hypothetical protein